MTTASEENKERMDEESRLATRKLDRIYENFRRDLERTFRPWAITGWDWELPSLFESKDFRVALCDLLDRGDKYELQIEVPGIEKEKIDVKATKHSIEISGKQTEKTEEKAKDYVYNERSYKSFFRRVLIPEEIVPSKINAKMNNGILNVELPKKIPTKVGEESTNVKVQ
jgi:HSP20 family protein